MKRLRLYDYPKSGNAYKVRLLLNLLGQPFERVHVDILKGEARTPAFAAKNPNGRVPVVEWPDGRRLAESNAILFHFAEGTNYLPDDPWMRAQVLQWQFYEQYSHQPYIGAVRFWHFAGVLDENRALLERTMQRGYRALEVMEGHLSRHAFFVADRYTIADISLYAYTHVAGEGGYDLEPFPYVRAWIERVRAQPGHSSITE